MYTRVPGKSGQRAHDLRGNLRLDGNKRRQMHYDYKNQLVRIAGQPDVEVSGAILADEFDGPNPGLDWNHNGANYAPEQWTVENGEFVGAEEVVLVTH